VCTVVFCQWIHTFASIQNTKLTDIIENSEVHTYSNISLSEHDLGRSVRHDGSAEPKWFWNLFTVAFQFDIVSQQGVCDERFQFIYGEETTGTAETTL